jgi:hypothetical protein
LRCAADLRALLAQVQPVDISGRAWGLLTGMVVSYARPFTKSYAYGKLEPKWARFPNRPDLAERHKRLLRMRDTLLAHNDLTPHRRVLFFTTGAMLDDRPTVTEGRAPVNLPGIDELQGLFSYQDARFADECEELARRLEELEEFPPAHAFELQLRTDVQVQAANLRPHRAPELLQGDHTGTTPRHDVTT